MAENNHWISEETLNKIRERKEAKSASGTHSNYYKTTAKEVKQMCRRDKKLPDWKMPKDRRTTERK